MAFQRTTALSGDELLADVIANPDDDGPRLVYADWLAQHDDPRGELIILQCELAAYPSDDATHAREQALLEAHRATWVKETTQVARECRLRRGFVSTIVASAQAFASRGAPPLDREPIEELVVCDYPSGAALETLASAPHLARLRAVRITSNTVRDTFADHLGVRGLTIKSARVLRSLRTFMASPFVDKLRELDLQVTLSDRVPVVGDLFADITSNIPNLRLEANGARWIADVFRAAFPHAKILI